MTCSGTPEQVFYMTHETQTIPRSDFNRDMRSYDDKTTWLAEALDGQMLTEFSYMFDGHELYGRDGGALTPIFEDATKDAKRIADVNPNLAFELRRRNIERAELTCMLGMANDELPNTMVVVSDFPPELMNSTRDVGGYNVRRRQTMLRVITKAPDGIIKMASQSLDQSDRQALEAIYHSLGFEPQSGELLGQRMHLELSPEQQEFLSAQLTGVYDRSLTEQYGSEWYAGRSPAEMLNTYDFVRSQYDLLDAYRNLENQGIADNSSLYNLVAAMQARLDRYRLSPAISFVAPDPTGPLLEMANSGQQARHRGLTFSGCGDTLVGKGDLGKAGYGNMTTTETEYEFDQEMYCVVCQPDPDEDEEMKMCGPCGLCKECDSEARAKAEAETTMLEEMYAVS